MDWNSRRITAIIENALNEDRATHDSTSYACIEANQRASATILAKEDCILSGIGSVSRSHDASRDFRWHPPAQGTVDRGHSAQCARDSLLRAGDSEFHAAAERYCHAD